MGKTQFWALAYIPVAAVRRTESIVDVDVTKLSQRCTKRLHVLRIRFDLQTTVSRRHNLLKTLAGQHYKHAQCCLLFTALNCCKNSGLHDNRRHSKGLKKCVSELRSVVCHIAIASHSVTCHLTQLNAPRLKHKLVLD